MAALTFLDRKCIAVRSRLASSRFQDGDEHGYGIQDFETEVEFV